MPAGSAKELLWNHIWMHLNKVASFTDIFPQARASSTSSGHWLTLSCPRSTPSLLFCIWKQAFIHCLGRCVFTCSLLWPPTPVTLWLVLSTLMFFFSSWNPSRSWVLTSCMLEVGWVSQMPGALPLVPNLPCWYCYCSLAEVLFNLFHGSERNILPYERNISSDWYCKWHPLAYFFQVNVFMKSIWMMC